MHANDFLFYEEVNDIVQEEPSEALDPETLGLLASIGIEKGKSFAPDERMKKILVEAAAVGTAGTAAGSGAAALGRAALRLAGFTAARAPPEGFFFCVICSPVTPL